MMNITQLFDLGKHIAPEGPDSVLEHVCMGRVLNNHTVHFPFLCPVILNIGQELALKTKLKQEEILTKPSSSHVYNPFYEVRIFSRFPQYRTRPENTTASIFINDLELIGSKQVLNNHKFKTVKFFDKTQIKVIKQYAEEHGAITLIVKEEAAIIGAIESITDIKDAFTYCCFMKAEDVRAKPADDDFPALFMSFIDLPYVMPIFNKKKVNGLGVRIGLYWPKITESNNKLTPIYEVYFIVSMFEENVLYIDGNTLNRPGMDDKSQKELFIHCLKKSLKSQEKKEVPNKKLTTSKNSFAIDLDYTISNEYKIYTSNIGYTVNTSTT